MRGKFSLVRGKGIFITDIILAISFIFLVWSGLALHMASHQDFSFSWTNKAWAYIHIGCSVSFIILLSLHIKSHLNWFKGLLNRGLKKRSKITALISLLFLLSLSTGIYTLFIENLSIGLIHYQLSLIMLPFALTHIITRIPLIGKAFKKTIQNHPHNENINHI